MFLPNNRASNFLKEKLIELQKERDEFTITDGDINMSVSEMEISGRKKISKDIVNLKTQSTNQKQLASVDYFIQNQQNTHSSQTYMDNSLR